MSNRLRAVREKLGLSQEAVARLLGVSLQSVYRWEKGKFEPGQGNDTVLQLISILASGNVPEWCKAAKREGPTIAFLSKHVGVCSECKMAAHYLDSIAK